MPFSCPICDGPCRVCFRTLVLRKYDADYWFCPACGLVQPETPFWLDEAYSSAITKTDIGLVARNVHNCRTMALLGKPSLALTEYVENRMTLRILKDVQRTTTVPAGKA